MLRAPRVFCSLGATLLALGCTGAIGPGADQSGASPNVPNGTGPAAAPGAGSLSDTSSVPAEAPLRRLTQLEYANTVRDLLGITGPIGQGVQLVGDSESGNAGFVRGGPITGGDDARNLMATSAQAVEGVKLEGLLPCTPLPGAAPEQDACVARFIPQFGKRAYRRPLAPREVELAQNLYQAQRSPEIGASFEQAVRAVIAAFIQAPQFLYRWELGPNTPVRDGALIRYNSWEVASRLSYLLWATMPDDKLLTAAEADALRTPEQIAQQATRLLADDRAKQGLADFHLQWLEVGPLTQVPKDEEIKSYSPAVAQSMLDETRDFTAGLYRDEKGGSLEALLTSTSTVVDANAGKIYGVTGTGKVALNPAERAGIFTQLAFLTSHADTGDSHPIKRSDAFLRRVLCMELQVPASLEVPPVADPSPDQTTRERFDVHGQASCARACHSFLDPIGFAFENYDTIGAYRTRDRNKPVDATGSVSLLSGKTVTFKNAVDMIGQLAKLPEVRECMSRQWIRYMLGRREVDGEKPTLDVLDDLFEKSNYDLRQLLVGLTRTRSFTHRSLSTGEVMP
jgi:hypothetical protein